MELLERLKTIPQKPGCYLWKDEKSRVIYVGKAKNLYKRTHQYFNRAHDLKTQNLVRDIRDFEYIIVNSEKESLLLEFNLIKKHMPRYNIMLKDGVSYPYIQITNEEHPRFLYARKVEKNRGKFYGPFPDGSHAFRLLNLLKQIFPLRKCTTLPKNKCIYYDIGQCLAPCIKFVEQTQYELIRRNVDDLLTGKNGDILHDLKARELKASTDMDFEGAHRYLQLQAALKDASYQQTVDLLNNRNIDVVGHYQRENKVAIVIFSYTGGKLISRHDHIAEVSDDFSEQLANYLLQYYSINNVPSTIYAALEEDEGTALAEEIHAAVHSPRQGKFYEIMLTAIKNCKDLLDTKIDAHNRQLNRTVNAAKQLGEMLQIDYPQIIEAFDVSNIQGTNAVATMITMRDGVKSKNDYRKFNIKTINHSNDVGMLKEVLYRRYFKIIKESLPFPDLIIVDGGTPQVAAAKEVFDGLYMKVPLIGLAKDDRHRTDAIIRADLSRIELDKKSDVFFFLSNIQEEVHRFAISFYRDKHLKSQTRSILDGIPGLGHKRQNKVLEHFENIQNIKNAKLEEIMQFVPRDVAEAILRKLNSEDKK